MRSYRMLSEAATLDLSVTALAGLTGAVASFAVMRRRIRNLEETIKPLRHRLDERIGRLVRSQHDLSAKIIERQKDDLALENRLVQQMRTMEQQNERHFVNAREYSVTVADMRRRIERVEIREVS